MATVAVFTPVLGFDFVSLDDPELVTGNLAVRSGLSLEGLRWAFATTHAANWHPLTWVSHMLDVELFGLNPGKHHQTSLLLHVGAVVLLFAFLRGATGRLGLSCFVAALFAVHPQRVESVAWVAERKDVLSGFFGTAALLAYLAYVRRPSAGRYVASFALFALGLLAKPMLVTFPFLLLVLDRWPLGRVCPVPAPGGGVRATARRWRRLVREKAPFLAASAAVSLVTLATQKGAGAVVSLERYPLAVRLEKLPVALLTYLGKTAWPHDLAVFYPHPTQRPPSVLLASAACGLLWATVLALRARRRPALGAGWLWFVGTMVPVSGLVQVGSQFTADRYTYLPSVGIFLGLSWAAADFLGRGVRARASLALLGLLTVLCAATAAHVQVYSWRNSKSLFRHALAATEGNWLAQVHLGSLALESGDLDGARRYLSAAESIQPSMCEVQLNLGYYRERSGEREKSAEHYRRALLGDSCAGQVLEQLASRAAAQGRPETAEMLLRESVRRDSRRPQGQYALGMHLASSGRVEEAIEWLGPAAAGEPFNADYQFALAAALANQGRLSEAVLHYRRNIALRGDHAEGHNNLGAVLARLGRLEEARGQFVEALRLKPDLEEAQRNLGYLPPRRPPGR